MASEDVILIIYHILIILYHHLQACLPVTYLLHFMIMAAMNVRRIHYSLQLIYTSMI